MKLAVSNVPSDHADRIARTLVEEGLVACVNLLPIRSVYRWKTAVCEEPEVTLWMKVPDHGVDSLRTRLLALHPYELPEFIVLPVGSEGSLPAYLAWVDSQGRSPA
jgi:periplasmic divalent cation tolerance protein